jgi:hypothetical protein
MEPSSSGRGLPITRQAGKTACTQRTCSRAIRRIDSHRSDICRNTYPDRSASHRTTRRRSTCRCSRGGSLGTRRHISPRSSSRHSRQCMRRPCRSTRRSSRDTFDHPSARLPRSCSSDSRCRSSRPKFPQDLGRRRSSRTSARRLPIRSPSSCERMRCSYRHPFPRSRPRRRYRIKHDDLPFGGRRVSKPRTPMAAARDPHVDDPSLAIRVASRHLGRMNATRCIGRREPG